MPLNSGGSDARARVLMHFTTMRLMIRYDLTGVGATPELRASTSIDRIFVIRGSTGLNVVDKNMSMFSWLDLNPTL